MTEEGEVDVPVEWMSASREGVRKSPGFDAAMRRAAEKEVDPMVDVQPEPSLVQAGREKLDERAGEEAAIRKQRCLQNAERTRSKFYFDFFRDRYVYNPETRRHSVPADNPLPAVEGIAVHDDGMYFADVGHADVSFTCEGLRFRCRWEYHGGGDRAFWDDGWWPTWFLLVRRRRHWLRFLHEDVERPVHGPESITEALVQ